jgi:hypothetical protein
MSLTVTRGTVTDPSGGGTLNYALPSSVGIGQVIVAITAGGSVPGSQAVSDNINTGAYSLLASFPTGQISMWWIITNASGTPTVTMTGAGGFTFFSACAITGFVGTPTSDIAIQATATAVSGTVAINATSNFANEVMLIGWYPSSTTFADQLTGYTGWTDIITQNVGSQPGFFSVENTLTTNNFSGTFTSGHWFLQLAGIYDAPTLNVATIAWVT